MKYLAIIQLYNEKTVDNNSLFKYNANFGGFSNESMGFLF